MFGFGITKYKEAISSMVVPLSDAFISQMDEVRESLDIPVEKWDRWEAFAFVMWTIHIGIMNMKLPLRRARKLQLVLSYAANVYVFENLSSSGEFWSLPTAHKRQIHDGIIDNVQQRAFEYNEAFNRDKVLSFDYSVAELEVNRHVVGHLISCLITDDSLKERADAIRPTLSILVAQAMTQAFAGLGISV